LSQYTRGFDEVELAGFMPLASYEGCSGRLPRGRPSPMGGYHCLTWAELICKERLPGDGYQWPSFLVVHGDFFLR